MVDSSTLKNPFVGLRAFEEHEDYLFFGRSIEINDLLKKFSNSRFLAVIGSSGSGKSSLVKSGLLPAIYSGFMSVGSNWRVALLRPGNDPIGNMAHELASEGVLYENVKSGRIPYDTIIESTLKRSGGGLVQAYRQAHLAPTENLLIVIDQFEELFRFSKYEKDAHEGKSDALGFINLLLTAAQQRDYPVYVLLTMRSDFLGDCAEFRGLPEAINEGQYLVPRMTRDEIREAITGPVAVSGAQIAPRLLTRVLNDVGNNLDQLPILQHAMMRTWDVWQKKNKPDVPIDIEDYERTGGMATALSEHADEAYAELTTDKQRLICELMFKALTDKAADVRGIRRPKSMEDLCALTNSGETEVTKVVEVFRKAGRTFLMPPPNVPLDKSSIIDISHESLMRVWQKLVVWTEEEVVSSTIYKRLADAAEREATYKRTATATEWEENKNGLLWVNPELQIALNWRKRFDVSDDILKVWAKPFNTNFDQSIDFLKRSDAQAATIRNRKARRLRLTFILAGALTLIFMMLSAISYYNKVKADKATIAANTAADSATVAKFRALRSDSLAQLSRDSALVAKDNALAAQRRAEQSDSLTKVQKQIADSKTIEAVNSATAATKARNKADSLLNRVAAAEYQRLIREGPIDEDLIYADTFDFKLIAYDYHLGILNVKPKNDELYEKLYYCLKFGPNAKAAIEDISASHYTGLSDTFLTENGTKIFATGKSLYFGNDIMYFKYDISALSVDQVSKRIFVATNEYDLRVLKYSTGIDTTENLIPLGGRITAIDYHNSPDVIFFGLSTGEVGYIKYADKKESRYQPVYRNDLGGPVTALDFFEKENNRHYLMASSSKGKVVVFESGFGGSGLDQFLNPNNKLAEILLPDNFGDVKEAKYDAQKDRVIFSTSKRTYSWNPFVEQLLPELEAVLDKKRADMESIKTHTKYYTTDNVKVAAKFF